MDISAPTVHIHITVNSCCYNSKNLNKHMQFYDIIQNIFTPESHLCSAYSFLPKPNLWQSILFIMSPYFCLSQVVIPWGHIANSLFRSIILLSNMHLSFLHGFSRFFSSYLVPNNIQLSRYITVFMYAFTYQNTLCFQILAIIN